MAPSGADASGGGSALLLRLFESDFFNVHLAVAYLKNYPDSIGITYYLIARLSQYPESDVEFYWPQLWRTLWYLQASLNDLSSNPSSQSFVVCRRAFNRVQTIVFSDPLAELVSSSSTASTDSSAPVDKAPAVLAPKKVTKVGERALSTAVGLGLVIGAVGLPKLPQEVGKIAIEQGRMRDEGDPAPSASKTPDREEPRQSSDDAASDDGQAYPNEPPKLDKGKGRAPPSPTHERRKPSLSDALGSPPASPRASPRSAKPKSKATPSEPNYFPGPAINHSPIPYPADGSPRQTFRRPSVMSIGSIGGSPTAAQRSFPGAPRLQKSDSMRSVGSNGKLSRRPALDHASRTTQVSPRIPSGSMANGTSNPASRSTTSLLGSKGPSQSVPSLPLSASSSQLAGHPHSRWQPPTIDTSAFPATVLTQALRCHAMRSQLDLLTSLQDISTRLVVVPKMARLSALRAELTVLNHGLPRGCCLGMYCPGEGGGPPTSTWLIDASEAKNQPVKAHHRIVRISPNESVVLNSADRAPFLIHVEVLEDDLDFNPARRQNSEDLRRALGESTLSASNASPMLRHMAAGSVDYGLDTLKSQTTPRHSPNLNRRGTITDRRSPLGSPTPEGANGRDQSLGTPLAPGTPNGDQSPGDLSLGLASPASPLPPDEEMDLVEQLYGSASLLNDHDPTGQLEQYVPRIENRAIDEEAWRRVDAKRRSVHATPSKTSKPSRMGPGLVNTSSLAEAAAAGHKSAVKRKPITLDEYAERMRMAAIMLAQLNASQQFGGAVGSGAGSAAGQLVGGALGLGASVGAGLGGAVGAGLGAVVSRLNPSRRESLPGQASSGLRTSLDTTHAATGLTRVTSPTEPTHASSFDDSTRKSIGGGNTQPQARQRVLSPQESQAIKDRIMNEMMTLEEERMERMRLDSLARSSGWTAGGKNVVDEGVVMRAVNKDDPSGSMLGESWSEKKARIRAVSPYGHLVNWNVFSVIVKTGADLRQEQLVTQLIKEFGRIWREEGTPVWVRYYRIFVTGESTGLMETIVDAVSLHSLKKAAYSRLTREGGALPSYSMYDYYLEAFGDPTSSAFRKAQDNFLKSLVAYSIISYLLQLKDRHNGNILVDKHGHIIHIDFGFVLSNSPGSIGFEMAPFKLSQDYIDILGGLESEKWAEFRSLFRRAFRDVRKHAERIITIVELMQHDSRLPCFGHGDSTARLLRERFQLGLTSAQCDDFAEKLILSSASSVFTRLYDTFQYYSQGVL